MPSNERQGYCHKEFILGGVELNRIWIAGCAGSGKTTLVNILGDKLDIPVYYRDLII